MLHRFAPGQTNVDADGENNYDLKFTFRIISVTLNQYRKKVFHRAKKISSNSAIKTTLYFVLSGS